MNFAKTRKFYPLFRLEIYHTKKGGWAFSGIPQFSLLLGLEMWAKFTEKGSVKVEVISVCSCTHTPLCYRIYMLGRYAMLRIQGWCWIAVWILIIQNSLWVFHTAVDCNTQRCLIVCLRLKNLLFKCLLPLKDKKQPWRIDTYNTKWITKTTTKRTFEHQLRFWSRVLHIPLLGTQNLCVSCPQTGLISNCRTQTQPSVLCNKTSAIECPTDISSAAVEL